MVPPAPVPWAGLVSERPGGFRRWWHGNIYDDTPGFKAAPALYPRSSERYVDDSAQLGVTALRQGSVAMDLSQLANLGEFIGGVAVLVTLV